MNDNQRRTGKTSLSLSLSLSFWSFSGRFLVANGSRKSSSERVCVCVWKKERKKLEPITTTTTTKKKRSTVETNGHCPMVRHVEWLGSRQWLSPTSSIVFCLFFFLTKKENLMNSKRFSFFAHSKTNTPTHWNTIGHEPSFSLETAQKKERERE